MLNCCRFEALSSITVSFRNESCDRHGNTLREYDFSPTVIFRTQVLCALLETLASTTNDSPHCLTLSIIGVTNHNYAVVAAHPRFCSALGRLHSLKLNFVTEYLGPRYKPTGHPHFFFGSVGFAWLTPTMPNLTSLVLLSDSYWGYFPKVDISPLFFPCLQVLALGRYTFSHDWQLEWIIKHRGTLQTLYLYDCPIVITTRCRHGRDKDGYPITQNSTVISVGPERTKIYYATWSQYLRRMTAALLKLQVFKMFHESDVERLRARAKIHRPYFESYEDMATGLWLSRYMDLDLVKPANEWWMTHPGNGLENYDGDLEALQILLATIETRRND